MREERKREREREREKTRARKRRAVEGELSERERERERARERWRYMLDDRLLIPSLFPLARSSKIVRAARFIPSLLRWRRFRFTPSWAKRRQIYVYM